MRADGKPLSVHQVQPFVPGGKDYKLSQRFYQALGFTLTFDAGEVCGFSCGDGGGFLLQNYFVEAWAHNFMMQLVVDDLDAWWAHIQSLDLPARFGTPPPSPPAIQYWGRVVSHVIDPCGVLWHVVQKA